MDMPLPPNDRRRRWRSRFRQRKPRELFPQRFVLVKALIVLLFGVLIAQLARMQLLDHETYQSRAELNRLRIVPELPSRGLIYDRHGEQLVENVPIFSAGVVPADIPDDQFLSVVAELSQLTGASQERIADAIVGARESADPFTPVVVKADLDEETAFRLRERLPELPGARVLVESIRRYPTGPLAAQILGYVGRISPEEFANLQADGYLLNDRLGKAGVEITNEAVLRGAPGYRQVEIDAAGREVRTLRSVPPQSAASLVLALDLDLQGRVQEILQEAMGDSLNAAAVVMNVDSGEVLAMVSLPAYDNNILTDPVDQERLPALLSHPAKPLVNHAIAEIYPPGSTFKLVTGTAALQEGVATPDTRITSTGAITVRREYGGGVDVFPDWAALGTLDFYRGVAMSSDVYFYYLAGGYTQNGSQVFRGLGAQRLADYARQYGLGAPTGIDLPGEAAGVVPDPAWKQQVIGEPWFLGDTYNYGIGQSYLAVTPLQLLGVTVAVANGGDVLVPHVVREIIDSDGEVIRREEREVTRSLDVSEANLAVMREAMRQAALDGTATSGASAYVTIAGKTGTAEFGTELPDGSLETHGWYTGFGPFDDPEIAVVVFLEKGKGGGDAGPAAKQIFDYYFARQRLAEEAPSP